MALPAPRPPTGKDTEIFDLAKRTCGDCGGYEEGRNGCVYGRPYIDTSTHHERAAIFLTKVCMLVQEAGSLARRNALYAACSLNDVTLVRTIL